MSREALGWPAPKAHLEPFDALERHSILEMEPPEHTRLRNLVDRAFVSRQDEKLAPRIAARKFADFIMRGYAKVRRAEPRDDLIGQLLIAESEDERLSEDELVGTCILLLNAGHEATVNAIGNAVRTILDRGLDPRTLFADPIATAAAVEELLRLDPLLHLFTRYALEDVEASGVSLRTGDRIGLLPGAANRDPERFPDPDAFAPGRDPNPHLTFGAGLHFCVGAPLVRLEMAVALPILFERLPRRRLAERPRCRDAFHFHGLEALRVAWG